MDAHGRESMRFTLNGHRYELSREDVENRLAGMAPDAIRMHAVKVNNTWFPVIQAFEVATGIPRSEFVSNTARRHLAALGYEVAGDVERRTAPPTDRSSYTPPAGRSEPRSPEELEVTSGEWHTEANIQASVVTTLAADGWCILSVANTSTKEHGIDVIAARDTVPRARRSPALRDRHRHRHRRARSRRNHPVVEP